MNAFRYRPLACIALLAVAALAPVASIGVPPARALAAQGQADASLARRLERLSQLLDDRRIELHIPGAALAITKGDDALLLRGFGVRDVEKQTPVMPDTLFAIGSHTKSFTSALVAMLVDQGLMSWDEPVRTHLPAFHLRDKEADEQVVLRDLLCHRTGLTRLSLLWANGTTPRGDVIRRVADAKPLAPFRTRFLYNNVTYMAAGMAAERAAGDSWEDLVQTRIFDPLGMRDSNTSTAQAQKNPHLSLGYQWEDSTQTWTRLPMRTLTSAAPAGAINSTAADLSRWVRFVASKGEFKGQRLISTQRFDEMWTPQIEVGGGLSYGLGWMVGETAGHRVAQHGGNIDGFSSSIGVFPDDQVGFALLCNVTATPLQQEIVDMVAQALLSSDEDFIASLSGAANADQAEADAGKPANLSPYLGRYHLDALDRDVTVLERDGRLALDVPGQTVFTLKWPDDEGKWVFELTDQVAVSFTPGDDGPMASLTVHQGGANLVAPRVSSDAGFTAADVEALRAAQGKPPARFRLTGTVQYENQGVSGTINILVDGDRFASTQDLGELGKVGAIYDGHRCWAIAPGAPPREVFGEQLEQVRLESPATAAMPLKALYKRIEPMRIEERDGRRVYVVRLTPALAPPSTSYIDAETGRTIRREGSVSLPGAGGLPVTMTFDDFRPFGAAEFPFHIISETTTVGRATIQFERVDVDPPIDESAFTLAESVSK